MTPSETNYFRTVVVPAMAKAQEQDRLVASMSAKLDALVAEIKEMKQKRDKPSPVGAAK